MLVLLKKIKQDMHVLTFAVCMISLKYCIYMFLIDLLVKTSHFLLKSIQQNKSLQIDALDRQGMNTKLNDARIHLFHFTLNEIKCHLVFKCM